MSHRPLVAIIHYHLRSGGVTKVISQAVKALETTQIDTVIISGSDCDFHLPANTSSVVYPELGYQHGIHVGPETLLDEISKKIISTCGKEPDIWHFHNHSIGKNISLTLAASILADNGKKVLFQIHDFPEDRRPMNYAELLKYTKADSSSELEKILYPKNQNVHYAVLNSRDFTYLSKAGFSQNNLHNLLNPVNLPHSEKKNAKISLNNKKIWLYPSRCIRRKNMGEFLLWAALTDKTENIFASTLKPTSQADMPFYNRWKTLASEYNLPVEFEVGLKYKHDFSQWIESAWTIVTTSVGEGFGLAFLEPFLFKKPIVGRDIEDITADFKNNGVSYQSLYNQVRIPVDWVGEEVLFKSIETGMLKMYKSYKTEFKTSMAQSAYDAAVLNGFADFGRLDESLQEKVIKQVISKPSLKDFITPNSLLPGEYNNTIFKDNYELTCKHYGLATYKDNLMKIYNDILNSNASGTELKPKNTLLEQFLCPEDFYLLRT